MPKRKTSNLRAGRISVPGARYFLTAVVKNRRIEFSDVTSMRLVSNSAHKLVEDGDVAWVCATSMPDHVHALFELGCRLSLGRTIAKFKAEISRHHPLRARLWQEDAFEHRLRDHEEMEDYAFYIFMNPYAAGLVDSTSPWPGWMCSDRNRFGFLEHTEGADTPRSEWLQRNEAVATRLTTGE